MNISAELSGSSRRAILKGWLSTSSLVVASAILAPIAEAAIDRDVTLAVTPDCGPDDGPTRTNSEGPFYQKSPPEKRNFRADAPGFPVTLIGYVLTRDCQPVANAVVDLWHANHEGAYDNHGFALRGYQRTDDQGRYYFDTIRPAQYAGRTPHYHVKIHTPDGATLTTQLYFPDEVRNDEDFLFDSSLLMDVQSASDGEIARFDFVV
ncbi:intradiol ring-cleavage dioxygenase [Thalassospira sp. MA62]|nr:intradiol ring-cleavage dioxygenase [Thalassospira sp. MA62]